MSGSSMWAWDWLSRDPLDHVPLREEGDETSHAWALTRRGHIYDVTTLIYDVTTLIYDVTTLIYDVTSSLVKEGYRALGSDSGPTLVYIRRPFLPLLSSSSSSSSSRESTVFQAKYCTSNITCGGPLTSFSTSQFNDRLATYLK
jgi:hypothetical protein